MGRLWSQLAPRRLANEIAGVAVDAVRSRRELIIEKAVLRHQEIAGLKLETMGMSIDKLTPDQIAYASDDSAGT